FLFREDPLWAERAAKVSALAKDVSEVMARLGLKQPAVPSGLAVAYHGACSLQHGQRVTLEPRSLITAAGFRLLEIPEGHLCCGSAGTYNPLEPEIAADLRARKLANIEKMAPDLVATGNIGCITPLAGGTRLPLLHLVELLDWATGGPVPAVLAGEPRVRPDHNEVSAA